MSSSKQKTSKLGAHYDKGIAALVMVLLLISLVYLVWKVGSTRKLQQATIAEVTSLTPDNEFAAEVDTTEHDRALLAVSKPIQLDSSGWTNRMLFVPESRLTCTACGAPRPMSTQICPWSWCGADHGANTQVVVVVVDLKKDTDGDGMYDTWETKYGLDHEDPSDAGLDGDRDTFTNLEEFQAKPQTDPTNQRSRPSFFPEHVVATELSSHAFQMTFSSKTKNIHGDHSFGLNYRSGNETITKFIKLGDTFAGFTVKGFEPKMIEVTEPFKRTVDVSELTLAKGKLSVVLVFRKASNDVDRTAVLAIPRIVIAGKVKTFEPVREGDTISIDRNTCVVTNIDTDKGTVVLNRERDGKAFTILER